MSRRDERLRRERELERELEDLAIDDYEEARRAFDEREPELDTYGLRVEPSPGGTAYGIYPPGTSDAGVASGSVRPLAWIEDRLPIQRDFDRAADKLRPGPRVGKSRRNPVSWGHRYEPSGDVLDAIRSGDRVTIRDRFGKERTGRAVMRGPHGWVLNMGGAHGTPAVATAASIVRVKGPARTRRNPKGAPRARAASNPKGVQRFLVNPDRRRAKPRRKAMAKRRTPPRYKSGPKKGQFMPRSARRRARRNPGRTVAPPVAASNPRRRRRRRSTSRPRARRRARRNPPRRGLPAPRQIVRTLTDGMIGAGQVLVGKAFVRSVPDLAGLPKEGNVGLAVQAAVALVGGILADMFLSKDASRAILYGGLSAPAETVIVAYKVPWLSQALSPVSATAGLSAYVMGGNGNMRLGAYARERLQLVSNDRGLGSYVSASSR